MIILVKEIDGDRIIIGTTQHNVAVDDDITLYEIPDKEYSSDMILSKLDGFDDND